MAGSFFWYDYETSGLHPGRDRPLQFGGVRTDLELNPIGEPIVLYSRLTPDALPHPDACLITGITPLGIADKSIRECEFIERIHQEFLQPETCVLGYNSLRFDDEVTRYTLFRNLMDPYAREWRNGNSRWDLIQLVRMTRALRPEGVNWPVDPMGSPTLRLESLTRANQISHEAAHDAMSDVWATLALARLIRSRQPRLFDYLFANRGKRAVESILAPGQLMPVLHASSRYPLEQGQLGVIVAIALHPDRANTVIAFDLSFHPQVLEKGGDDIEVSQGGRQPLFMIKLNQCPALAPLSTLREEDAERLAIDVGQYQRHLNALRGGDVIGSPCGRALLERVDVRSPSDCDLSLYEGFLPARDRQALDRFRCLPPEAMGNMVPAFEDARVPEMVFRFRARNYPETLDSEEQERWRDFCRHRLLGDGAEGGLTLKGFSERLKELSSREDLTAQQKKTLEVLRQSKVGFLT